MARIALYIVMARLLTSSLVYAQPNVLLIIGDDQKWSDYGFMGHPVIETPNRDRLASGGFSELVAGGLAGFRPASGCASR